MIEPIERQKTAEESRNHGLERAPKRANTQDKNSLVQAILRHADAADAVGANQIRIECDEPPLGTSTNIVGSAFAQMAKYGVIRRLAYPDL
jgi:hypothetical protein